MLLYLAHFADLEAETWVKLLTESPPVATCKQCLFIEKWEVKMNLYDRVKDEFI